MNGRTCPSCKSDRCGNHAACARRLASSVKAISDWLLFGNTWVLIGLTEVAFQTRMGMMNPMMRMIASANAETIRTQLAFRAMESLKKSALQKVEAGT